MGPAAAATLIRYRIGRWCVLLSRRTFSRTIGHGRECTLKTLPKVDRFAGSCYGIRCGPVLGTAVVPRFRWGAKVNHRVDGLRHETRRPVRKRRLPPRVDAQHNPRVSKTNGAPTGALFFVGHGARHGVGTRQQRETPGHIEVERMAAQQRYCTIFQDCRGGVIEPINICEAPM